MTCRKICVVLTTRGNYAKMKSVITEIDQHPDLELQVVAGGGLVLEKYGKILEDDITQNIKIDRSIFFVVEGETPLTMAKSAGLAVSEFATAFSELEPDIVVVIADRFECLAVAMAATYMNIPVAHVEGGEVSGSIDESIRHAITKLAHIHFPASIDARDRIIRLGEDEATVFCVGASSVDALCEVDLMDLGSVRSFCQAHGVGARQDLMPGNYLLVIQHPVTTEYEDNYRNVNETISAVTALSRPTVWIWPNMDAGSDGVSKAIREFRESGNAQNVYFFKSLPIEVFGPLLKNASCILGNSSSGLREAAFLGTPSVNIGVRQTGRYRGEHVVDVDYDRQQIANAVDKQIAHGPYEQDFGYGEGGSAKRIVRSLAEEEITVQKSISF
jgi:UDP-hydrolysing UDP-N-acetyl-D-glucosamine 2-epimerase